jgi:hypothetical protein
VNRLTIPMRLLILFLSLVLLAMFIPACSSQEGSAKELQIISQNLSSHSFGGDERKSTAVVSGRAKNVSNGPIKSATLLVNFFDEKDGLIANATTVKQNLAPGEIWEFAVEASGPDAWKITKYTIKTAITQ